MPDKPTYEALLAEVEKLRAELGNTEEVADSVSSRDACELLDITPDIMAGIDSEGHLHSLNRAGLEWLELPLSGSLPPLTLSDLFSHDEAQRLLSQGMERVSTQGEWRGGMVVLQRKQTRRPYLQRLYRNEGDNRFLLLLRDMTGMAAEGLELVEMERGFRQLAEISPMGIFRVNNKGTFVYVNPRWCEITGIPSESIIGMPWGPELHPEDRDIVAAKWQESKEKDIPFICEYRHVRGKGAYSWVLGQAAEEKNEKGEVVGFIGTVSDITEQKLAELESRAHLEQQVRDSKNALSRTAASLEASERLYGALIETVPNIIWVAQTSGEITYLNQTWYQFTGRPREKSVGMAWTEQIPNEIRASSIDHWLESLALGDPFNTQTIFYHRDGSQRVIEVMAQPIRDEVGHVIQWVGANSDITEKINARKELVAAKHAAEDAARTKSNFLATMSHEIRTPMNGIMGAVNLLLQEKLDQTQEEYAELIHQSTSSLLAVINDVLDYSKLEAGKLVLEELDFDLGSLVDNVSNLLQSAAEEKKLQFRTLFPAGTALYFQGDPTRIRQILLNLVSNAIKFTLSGEVCIEVKPGSEENGLIPLKITVRDTGIGISDENLKCMFSEFFQADATITRKFGGTGLGLAISRRLSELMKGRITVSSQEGEGSVFTLHLSLPRSTRVPETNEENRQISRDYKRRALLVEDNKVNRLVAERLLSRLGLMVDLASNGKEAIENSMNTAYDVIFMDIQMPVMDGITATTRIRADQNPSRRARIIAMTANALHKDREICRAAGMDGFIPKPIERELIITELDKWFTANRVD